MSIQKDRERLINEAMDAYELMCEKLVELKELDIDIDSHASNLVRVKNSLDDIYAEVEDKDA